MVGKTVFWAVSLITKQSIHRKITETSKWASSVDKRLGIEWRATVPGDWTWAVRSTATDFISSISDNTSHKEEFSRKCNSSSMSCVAFTERFLSRYMLWSSGMGHWKTKTLNSKTESSTTVYFGMIWHSSYSSILISFSYDLFTFQRPTFSFSFNFINNVSIPGIVNDCGDSVVEVLDMSTSFLTRVRRTTFGVS